MKERKCYFIQLPILVNNVFVDKKILMYIIIIVTSEKVDILCNFLLR